MKIELVKVTPAMASSWLKCNTDNRPLRRGVVDGFKLALQRGEYIPTHQGICFSDTGVLLDGQHRLTAISELSGGAYEMIVVHGVSEEAFKVMDIGVKRKASDSLKENPKLVECARLAMSIVAREASGNAITPTGLIPYVEFIRPYHDELISCCSGHARIWSSAPARLAAIVSMIRGTDHDYVKSIYRALILADFDSMPRVAQALYRSALNGVINTTDRLDTVGRMLAAFDPKKSHNTVVKSGDRTLVANLLRETFSGLGQMNLTGSKKMAASQKQPKGNSRGNYRTNGFQVL